MSNKVIFNKTITENFTEYYKPLVTWLNRLRRVVFLEGRKWKSEDGELYTWIKEIIHEAQKHPEVLADEYYRILKHFLAQSRTERSSVIVSC